VAGASYAGQPSGGGATVTSGGGGGPAAASQLGAGINSLLGAIASGNKQAFDEAVRQFNATFGLDKDKFSEDTRRFNTNFAEAVRQFGLNYALSESGLTGTYQGAPTMQAQAQWASLYGQNAAPAAGQATLAAQQQAYAQQLGVASLASQLQANPFRQQQVLGQANRILQGQPTAGFQAPGVVPGVGTAGGNQQGGLGYLQQLIEDIKNPTPNQQTADQFLANTPTPNKIDSASFLRSAPSTQNVLLQAMQEKYGIDPNDALTQIKNTLPQFQAPTALVGTVKR
jgi:hypothetical protein